MPPWGDVLFVTNGSLHEVLLKLEEHEQNFSHLDSSLVGGEAMQRLRGSGLPDVEHVVVAAAGQLPARW